MENKYVLAILIVVGVLVLLFTLGPTLTGYVVYDNTIAHSDTIQINGDSFEVQFQDERVRLISGSGEVILKPGTDEVYNNKHYLVTNFDAAQKTAQLVVQSYSFAIDLTRAINKDTLRLGDEVRVLTQITNHESTAVEKIIVQKSSPAYEINSEFLLDGKPITALTIDEGKKIILRLEPEQTYELEIRFKLVNPDVESAIPELVLRNEISDDQIEIEAVSIPIEVDPLLEIITPSTKDLAISKEHELYLKLNNLQSLPLEIKKLIIYKPVGAQLTPNSESFKEEESSFHLETTLVGKQQEQIPFTLYSDQAIKDSISFEVTYEQNGVEVTTTNVIPFSFTVTPLEPKITINKNRFKANEQINILPFFINNEQIQFKNINSSVYFLSEQYPLVEPSPANAYELHLPFITQHLPYSNEEIKTTITFKGSYQSLENEEFTFETAIPITIQDADFSSDIDAKLIPIAATKGVVQYALLLTNLASGQISEVQVMLEQTQVSINSSSKNTAILFDVPTYTNADQTIEVVSLSPRVLYQKAAAQYMVTTNYQKPLKDIIKQVKLSQHSTDLSAYNIINHSNAIITQNVVEEQPQVYQETAFSFNRIYLIIIGIVVFVIILFFIFHHKKTTVQSTPQHHTTSVDLYHTPENNEGFEELRKYIEHCRNAQIPDDTIRKKLIEHGWLQDIIEEFMK